MLGAFLCHLLDLPGMCLSSPASSLSDGVPLGTKPLSTGDTCGHQKREFARKKSKASQVKSYLLEKENKI